MDEMTRGRSGMGCTRSYRSGRRERGSSKEDKVKDIFVA